MAVSLKLFGFGLAGPDCWAAGPLSFGGTLRSFEVYGHLKFWYESIRIHTWAIHDNIEERGEQWQHT